MPDPDLLIRTSGELRISNFFLFQLAYTELYFTETLWPDFRERDLLTRDRRLPDARTALRFGRSRLARSPACCELGSGPRSSHCPRRSRSYCSRPTPFSPASSRSSRRGASMKMIAMTHPSVIDTAYVVLIRVCCCRGDRTRQTPRDSSCCRERSRSLTGLMMLQLVARVARNGADAVAARSMVSDRRRALGWCAVPLFRSAAQRPGRHSDHHPDVAAGGRER